MSTSQTKWGFLRQHAINSCLGILGMLATAPVRGLRLLWARSRYFLNRTFSGPIDMGDGFTIETDRELISYWSFFVENECWAKPWADAIRQEEHPLILDVGANAGLFTHWIWRKKPSAKFVLFEPLPRMAAKIEGWIGRTGAKARVIRAAVADHTGTASFYLDADNDTTASLRPEERKPDAVEVPLTTLDVEMDDRPIFMIKIDVEGCEPEVLMGGRRTLARARFLIIEAHTPAALAKVREQLIGNWEHLQVGASDHLFIRQAA